MYLQLMLGGSRTIKYCTWVVNSSDHNGNSVYGVLSSLVYLTMFHITTPQNQANECPGMVVETVIITNQDLMQLDREPWTGEQRPTYHVRDVVIAVDNCALVKGHFHVVIV